MFNPPDQIHLLRRKDISQAQNRTSLSNYEDIIRRTETIYIMLINYIPPPFTYFIYLLKPFNTLLKNFKYTSVITCAPKETLFCFRTIPLTLHRDSG